MAVFHCRRFPDGDTPIRTRLGLVTFTGGRVEVDDPDLAAALRDVPASFQIEEEGGTAEGAAAPRPRATGRRRRTKEN